MVIRVVGSCMHVRTHMSVGICSNHELIEEYFFVLKVHPAHSCILIL